ncbi:MAG: putative ABC transporter permease, partial [Eubacteriales bacterium]
NIGGYVSLRYSLLWGVACILVLKVIMPIIDKIIDFTPHLLGYIIIFVIFGVMIADLAVTVLSIMKLNRRLRALDEISAAIRAGSDKLGEKISDETLELKEKYENSELKESADKLNEKYKAGSAKLSELYNESAGRIKAAAEESAVKRRAAAEERRAKNEENVERLRESYNELLSKNSAIVKRLVRAFPDSSSEKYSESYVAVKDKLRAMSDAHREKIQRQEADNAARYAGDELDEGIASPFAHGLCPAKLLWLFFIGGVVGFIIETLWCLIVTGHFEMRTGLVYGCFIPVYGFGAVLITGCLYRLRKKRDLWIFLGSAFIGGGFEYLCSLFQELVFGTVSWEYSNTPLNIGGRTNVMFMLMWGILGLLWVKDLYPQLSRLIEKIPKKIGVLLSAALAVLLAADMCISGFAVIRQNERRDNIPADGALDEWLDDNLGDEYLNFIYPNMIPAQQKGENATDMFGTQK